MIEQIKQWLDGDKEDAILEGILKCHQEDVCPECDKKGLDIVRRDNRYDFDCPRCGFSCGFQSSN